MAVEDCHVVVFSHHPNLGVNLSSRLLAIEALSKKRPHSAEGWIGAMPSSASPGSLLDWKVKHGIGK